MRDDIKKGVYVENLTEEIAANSTDAIDMLLRGASNRHVGVNKYKLLYFIIYIIYYIFYIYNYIIKGN